MTSLVGLVAEPPCRASSPTARLDGFLTDRLRYVEYNAETPAGIAYYDHLVDVFEALPVMRRFRDGWMPSCYSVQLFPRHPGLPDPIVDGPRRCAARCASSSAAGQT